MPTWKQQAQAMLDKCADDEPVWLLRAQDKLADDALLTYYANDAANEDSYIVADKAFQCAAAMKAWPTRKIPD